MKKVFLVAFILMGMLGGLAVPQDSTAAMPMHRQAPAASFYGFSWVQWNGGTLGAKSTFFLDNPGLANGGEWQRYIELDTSDYTQFAEFGLDKCNNSDNCLCQTFGRSALYVFTFTHVDGAPHCFEMVQNNDNINKQCTFTITDNSTNDGVEFAMSCSYDNSNHPCGGVGCSENFSLPSWAEISLNELINNTFTGHNVWGGSWTQNQYRSATTKAWNYQFRNTDAGYSENPPQMYWHQVPAPGNNGGSLYSCDYSSGTTCNYRS